MSCAAISVAQRRTLAMLTRPSLSSDVPTVTINAVAAQFGRNRRMDREPLAVDCTHQLLGEARLVKVRAPLAQGIEHAPAYRHTHDIEADLGHRRSERKPDETRAQYADRTITKSLGMVG